jgi:hypothetical protein
MKVQFFLGLFCGALVLALGAMAALPFIAHGYVLDPNNHWYGVQIAALAVAATALACNGMWQ